MILLNSRSRRTNLPKCHYFIVIISSSPSIAPAEAGERGRPKFGHGLYSHHAISCLSIAFLFLLASKIG